MPRLYVCDCGKSFSPNLEKWNDWRVKCDPCIRKIRARDEKAKAVAYKGGKCADCKRGFPAICFDFDHKDPTEKKFKISGKWILRWKELKKELDKTELRCACCHRLRHWNEQYGGNLPD